MSRTITARLSSFVVLLAVLVWALMPTSSLAVSVSWTGTDGGNPTFWDIGTTANWDNGGATTYTDGDDVTFDDTGTGTTVDLQTTVSPTSMVISSASTNAYSFSGGDIAGSTGITTSGGNLSHTFSQEDLAFSGNVAMSGSADIDFQPATGTNHDFGTGTIQLNSTGARFEYNPVSSSSTLTNDFEVNAANYLWRRPADSSNNYGGTVTLNANLSLGSHPEDRGHLRSDVILTDDRTISGQAFIDGDSPRVASTNITSSGGSHDLTLTAAGGNVNWELFVGQSTTTTPWDIQNLIRTPASGNSTLRFDVDERDFFDTITANGGQVRLNGSLEFMRTSVIEVDFDLVMLENTTGGFGTGFRNNTAANIQSGGSLQGDATLESNGGFGNVDYANAFDVNVFSGGEISPGDSVAVDTTDILTVAGDVDFSGGTLTIDITGSGVVAGDDFDRLVLQDSATPSGSGNLTGLTNATLNINFDGVDHDDLAGNVIDIILADNDLSSQSFDNITRNAGIDFDIIYGNGFVRLQNFQLHVPEPSSLTLLGLGACLAGWHRRRRRGTGRG